MTTVIKLYIKMKKLFFKIVLIVEKDECSNVVLSKLRETVHHVGFILSLINIIMFKIV